MTTTKQDTQLHVRTTNTEPRWPRAAFGIVLGSATIACTPAPRNANGDDVVDANTSTDSAVSAMGCATGADEVYTFDELDNHLYMFDPPSKTFTDLGGLSCPTVGTISTPHPTPYSMGVDRNTIGWLLYSDGEMFKVDINNNLSCATTSWHAPSSGTLATLVTFGMGFSTDTAGGDTDMLYIEGPTIGGMLFQYSLASLDPTTLNPTQIALESLGRAELTGNSNAELWGYFADGAVPHVVQFDKTTGALVKDFPEPPLMRPSPPGFAFAHWGGDYWVFLYNAGQTTTVYQIDGSTGDVKSTTNTGRTIVGAGVSTCAPVIL